MYAAKIKTGDLQGLSGTPGVDPQRAGPTEGDNEWGELSSPLVPGQGQNILAGLGRARANEREMEYLGRVPIKVGSKTCRRGTALPINRNVCGGHPIRVMSRLDQFNGAGNSQSLRANRATPLRKLARRSIAA
jgi:hypothetical protein